MVQLVKEASNKANIKGEKKKEIEVQNHSKKRIVSRTYRNSLIFQGTLGTEKEVRYW